MAAITRVRMTRAKTLSPYVCMLNPYEILSAHRRPADTMFLHTKPHQQSSFDRASWQDAWKGRLLPLSDRTTKTPVTNSQSTQTSYWGKQLGEHLIQNRHILCPADTRKQTKTIHRFSIVCCNGQEKKNIQKARGVRVQHYEWGGTNSCLMLDLTETCMLARLLWLSLLKYSRQIHAATRTSHHGVPLCIHCMPLQAHAAEINVADKYWKNWRWYFTQKALVLKI